jgi:hypothetical protein
MEIRDDAMHVLPSATKVEPEEAPAVRVLSVTEIGVTNVPQEAAVQGQTPAPISAMPGTVEIHGTAATFADQFRHRCSLCRNFSNRDWRELKTKMETTPEGRAKLHKIQTLLFSSNSGRLSDMHSDEEGTFDTEHATMALGLCRPISEILKETYVTHPAAGCPTYPGPGGEDLTLCFSPRNKDAEKRGNSIYDEILQKAASDMKAHFKTIAKRQKADADAKLHPPPAADPLPTAAWRCNACGDLFLSMGDAPVLPCKCKLEPAETLGMPPVTKAWQRVCRQCIQLGRPVNDAGYCADHVPPTLAAPTPPVPVSVVKFPPA